MVNKAARGIKVRLWEELPSKHAQNQKGSLSLHVCAWPSQESRRGSQRLQGEAASLFPGGGGHRSC